MAQSNIQANIEEDLDKLIDEACKRVGGITRAAFLKIALQEKCDNVLGKKD